MKYSYLFQMLFPSTFHLSRQRQQKQTISLRCHPEPIYSLNHMAEPGNSLLQLQNTQWPSYPAELCGWRALSKQYWKTVVFCDSLTFFLGPLSWAISFSFLRLCPSCRASSREGGFFLLGGGSSVIFQRPTSPLSSRLFPKPSLSWKSKRQRRFRNDT